MAAMLGEVYDALIAAGAPADKARQAAEAVASYSDRFNRIERDQFENTSGNKREFVDLRAEMRGEFASVRADIAVLRGDLTLLKWAVGLMLPMTAAILIRLFFN